MAKEVHLHLWEARLDALIGEHVFGFVGVLESGDVEDWRVPLVDAAKRTPRLEVRKGVLSNLKQERNAPVVRMAISQLLSEECAVSGAVQRSCWV